MLSASECQLKANNLEIAARSASPDNRILYLQAAAEWRRKAHEILMEQDAYRNAFLTAFDKMLEENKIATLENLKPF